MPDTTFYYHVAYVAAVVLYGGYVVSLWWRSRRLFHGAVRNAEHR